ncbi:hypothetical protein HMPREF1544_01227 [Mucor circinelloides 1006PhL]|uniref:Xylanolytic transcriptional activator regulatory domain-containing protein n=1 Tax=Mucor circinelloides f. circinelloides (strain 1006PhL) TaxID=1220926 RepID=S2K949_MUCC1|nr:hypothetical protein HMPREF1544_01227 [Mucor circinelloides 1006PhL]
MGNYLAIDVPEQILYALRALEKFLRQISNLLEVSDPDPPLYSNPNQVSIPGEPLKLSIHTSGRGCYVPDNPLRTDSTIKRSSLLQLPIESSQPIQQQPTVRENLLSIYFQFVDPLIPILHRPSFLQQLRNKTISNLLLNAIYCVSSRWDLAIPSIGEEPRGWVYYQKAIHLLDQQGEPQLSTIQAVFLLLKYNEHVRRPGFAWRTRYYFQMIVRMAKDLGLPCNIAVTAEELVAMERRKRTFWAIYCYDVMMSLEDGTVPHFSNVDCSVDIPHVLQDEAEEGDKIIHFILLTKIMRNQSDILQFLHAKYYKKMAFHWDHDKQFNKVSNDLGTTISLITSTTKFPQKETMCYTICFLYLASSFATILLYRHSDDYKKQCLEAALNIKLITELILECDAFEDMYCSMRGIQQIVHFLSAAITVFKDQEAAMPYKSTLQLAQKLASISPATEVIGHSNNNKLKRKSLHLPNETMVQDLHIPLQQLQQQQQQQPHYSPNAHLSVQYPSYQQHYMNQQYQTMQPSVMNIPNQQQQQQQPQQSLLGLLYNEDDL